MAVVRSTSFGKVRKSVGQETYYRRAGVQLVRSKPTFAPGRTFTPAQLSQQMKMKVAQTVMRDYSGSLMANSINVYNKKRYNASSRFNRLIANIIDSLGGYPFPGASDTIEIITSFFDVVFPKFAQGIIGGSVSGLDVYNGAKSLLVSIEKSSTVIKSLLDSVNKKRSLSGKVTMDNIGCCGFVRVKLKPSDQDYVVRAIPPAASQEMDTTLYFESWADGVELDSVVDQAFVAFFVSDFIEDENQDIDFYGVANSSSFHFKNTQQ